MTHKTGEEIVLVAALDWGIGHASRTVPLIRQLQSEGKKVTLASAGEAKEFYKKYFPELQVIEKPEYNIRYYKNISLTLSILLQVPKIILAVYREHVWLDKVLKKESIKKVISDNCYGLWSKKAKTIFITHQLMVKCPSYLKFAEPILHRCILYFVKKFDECHIPDNSDEKQLSGDLSHKYSLPANAKFIGPLSRFNNKMIQPKNESFNTVILLSGPEPQRSLMEAKCEKLLTGSGIKSCIIRGKPGDPVQKTNTAEISWFNHLSDEEMKTILLNAGRIVCRSGYSTLMDLHALNLKALLVPTPGQTEQEYLAKYNSRNDNFEMKSQDDITLNDLVCSFKKQKEITVY